MRDCSYFKFDVLLPENNCTWISKRSLQIKRNISWKFSRRNIKTCWFDRKTTSTRNIFCIALYNLHLITNLLDACINRHIVWARMCLSKTFLNMPSTYKYVIKLIHDTVQLVCFNPLNYYASVLINVPHYHTFTRCIYHFPYRRFQLKFTCPFRHHTSRRVAARIAIETQIYV